jgi:glycosyltransferase involved in cell wall biosynthesis
MKIAVYTIALNEEKHVERWYNSVKDADYILIADTGSTDRTVEIAKSLGITVYSISIKPWRFDVARNTALSLLPDDIDLCVSLDMDETISEGWREILEKTTGNQITYVFDNYHKQHSMVNNKIHSRHGYVWKFIMHEGIVQDRIEPDIEFAYGLEVYHLPDTEKPRSQYLDLIKAALDETRDITRYYKYYTDALVSLERYEEAETWYLEMMKVPGFSDTDKSHVYKVLADIVPEKRYQYLAECLKHSRERREPYYYLAEYYVEKEIWGLAKMYVEMAIRHTQPKPDIFNNPKVWKGAVEELKAKIEEWYNDNEQRIEE